jgi:hypothetical protein
MDTVMPRQNGKAKWAQATLDAAVATARDTMKRVSLDVHALTHEHGYVNVNGAQLDNYYYAGFYAATILDSAIQIVERQEKSNG